jgi:hypothetical protein
MPILFLILSSCSSINQNMIFIDHQPNYFTDINHWRDRIIIGNNIIDLNQLESKYGNLEYFFDYDNQDFWVISHSNKNIDIYLLDENKLHIKFSYIKSDGFYINNIFIDDNKVLICSYNQETKEKYFELYNIPNPNIILKINSIDIESQYIESKLHPIGFKNEVIYFYNGYYNMTENFFIFYKYDFTPIKYFQSENKVLVEIDDKFGTFYLYDIFTEEIQYLEDIQYPDGYALNFYLDGNDFYYSEEKHTWLNVILTLDYGPFYRHYYKYNLSSKEIKKIRTPTEHVDILGILK